MLRWYFQTCIAKKTRENREKTMADVRKASEVATELGISLARVKQLIKAAGVAYASDRRGDYLVPLNCGALITRVLLKPKKRKVSKKASGKKASKKAAAA